MNFMNQAETIENTIDAMRERFRDDHIQRLRSNECGLDQGLVYVSLLTNLEKIGDYCFNIAEAVAGQKIGVVDPERAQFSRYLCQCPSFILRYINYMHCGTIRARLSRSNVPS
jgi:phosphate uptake regulator